MVPSETLTGIEGDSLAFSCHVDGLPVPVVALGRRGGGSVRSSDRVKVAALMSKQVSVLLA